MHTFLHFLGELIVLQQRAHIATYCGAYDGLHLTPVFIQPKVKVSKPEDLIESCSDISCSEKLYSINFH